MRHMLSYSDLKPGVTFVLDGEPYKVLEYNFLRMQQRKPVAQTKIKNLRTNKIIQRNFHKSETFKTAEIERLPAVYLYKHRGESWFHEKGKPQARFKLNENILGTAAHFLKEKTEVITDIFNGDIINIDIPIKVDLAVTEAPPTVKGNTAQGGSKEATLETGYQLQVPLFVNEGDVVRVNTETGEYTERVEKH